MSIPELMTLTRKHWTKYLPNKVRELRENGELNEAILGAASLAQAEIDRLMTTLHYREHEAREVALYTFILLPEEKVDDEQARELADMEAAYQKNPPVLAGTGALSCRLTIS